MADVNNVVNMTELTKGVSAFLLDKLSPLITLFKVIGIVLLIYIIYLIIRGILNFRRNRRIDITYEKVLEIDKKLDELLKRTPKKEKAIFKQEKKPGFFARLFGKKEEQAETEKKIKEKKKK